MGGRKGNCQSFPTFVWLKKSTKIPFWMNELYVCEWLSLLLHMNTVCSYFYCMRTGHCLLWLDIIFFVGLAVWCLIDWMNEFPSLCWAFRVLFRGTKRKSRHLPVLNRILRPSCLKYPSRIRMKVRLRWRESWGRKKFYFPLPPTSIRASPRRCCQSGWLLTPTCGFLWRNIKSDTVEWWRSPGRPIWIITPKGPRPLRPIPRRTTTDPKSLLTGFRCLRRRPDWTKKRIITAVNRRRSTKESSIKKNSTGNSRPKGLFSPKAAASVWPPLEWACPRSKLPNWSPPPIWDCWRPPPTIKGLPKPKRSV